MQLRAVGLGNARQALPHGSHQLVRTSLPWRHHRGLHCSQHICHATQPTGDGADKPQRIGPDEKELLGKLSNLQAHIESLRARNQQLRKALGQLPVRQVGQSGAVSSGGGPGAPTSSQPQAQPVRPNSLSPNSATSSGTPQASTASSGAAAGPNGAAPASSSSTSAPHAALGSAKEALSLAADTLSSLSQDLSRLGIKVSDEESEDDTPAFWPSSQRPAKPAGQVTASKPASRDLPQQVPGDSWDSNAWSGEMYDEDEWLEGEEVFLEDSSSEDDEHLFDDWESMDVVFVSAEVAPWSKTGGLGDVIGSLPKAIAARGHRVMVVCPRYYTKETAKIYEDLEDTGVKKTIDLGQGGFHEVGYYHTHKDAVDWVFVDHISYQRAGNPYGNSHGVYQDNLFRFALLSMAAIEATLVLKIGGYRYEGVAGDPYGQRCLFVANDWHASLVPMYLGSRFKPHDVHVESRCVLALHNLAHQGSFPPNVFPTLGLPGDWYPSMEWVVNQAPPNGKGATKPVPTINCLKASLATSDKILTVSQNYAAEICDEQGQGCGLASLLLQRADVLRGIVNGVDGGEWDPATDVHLKYHYDASDLSNKRMCKGSLQDELQLPIELDRPLVGFIGRLDYQKGPDLVLKALEHLINLDCQVVILGSGAADYEQQVKQAQKDYPYFVRGITKFDVPLSHKIIAGCDILLMPSRFEPCGLNQLYAMRYGTVPVAHSTGGLRDTISDYNSFAPPGSRDRGTGWTFSPATLEAFVDAVSSCVKVYNDDQEEWQRLQKRCMLQDFSWGRAARQYETVFLEVMRAEEEDQATKDAKGAVAMARHQEVLKKQAEEADRLAAIHAAQEAAAAAIRAANAKALAEKQALEAQLNKLRDVQASLKMPAPEELAAAVAASGAGRSPSPGPASVEPVPVGARSP